MTYGEFKKMAEDAGVTDDCQIDSIGEIEIYVDKKSNRCQIQPKEL